MNESGFNKYCASVMGYDYITSSIAADYESVSFYYNPYNNLNQMAEVVEKLAEKIEGSSLGAAFIDMLFNSVYEVTSIKQTFRDFIESTME